MGYNDNCTSHITIATNAVWCGGVDTPWTETALLRSYQHVEVRDNCQWNDGTTPTRFCSRSVCKGRSDGKRTSSDGMKTTSKAIKREDEM